MPIQTTYTNARSQFAKLWDEVINNQEVVIIKRRGAEDVALIGKPEPLRFILSGAWSRRLTQEHRVVYTISDDRIDFL